LKSILACLLLLSFLPVSLLAQQIIEFKNGYKYNVTITSLTADTVKFRLISEPQVTRIASLDQVESISAQDPGPSSVRKIGWPPRPSYTAQLPPLEEALLRIKRAGTINGVGISLGCLHQATLLINRGFAHDSRNAEGYNYITGIIGGSIGFTRLALSITVPFQLGKAETAVLYFQQEPGNEGKFGQSLKSIRLARKITTAVPIMGFTSAGLMIITYAVGWNSGDKRNTGIEIAAWALMGATLATSVVSQFFIAKARKVLLKESGSLSLGVNQYGVGVRYRIGN